MTYAEFLFSELANFSIGNFEVVLDPPIVFSCGGEIDIRKPIPPSVRARFHEYCAYNYQEFESSLLLAESFKDYLREYSDLQEFENDIAHISSLIIIFVESAGSIAELGIFSASESSRKKVAAVVPIEKVRGKNSFIYLGPLEALRKAHQEAVLAYPFPSEHDREYPELEQLSADIVERVNKADKHESFQSDNFGHFFHIIHELVRLAWPIRESEIRAVLESLKVPTQGRLRRALYLLLQLEFIRAEPYSTTEWYYSSEQPNRIRFGASKSGTSLNLIEFQIALRDFTSNSKDNIESKRRSVLKSIKKVAK